MLITHATDGQLRARPMAIAQIEPSCRLWFLTDAQSAKVHEIVHDTHVHVVCQNDRSCYLSLSGRANLESDRAKVRDLWKESYRPWFPGGRDDPNLLLISVDPHDGEFWDQSGFKQVRQMIEAGRAYLQGNRFQAREEEEHGFVHLGSGV